MGAHGGVLVRRYLRQDVGDDDGDDGADVDGRRRSGGVRAMQPNSARLHGASPTDGRDCPDRRRSGRRLILRKWAAECPSSDHGVLRRSPNGSDTANCDRDSHGGGGGGAGGSTGSAVEAPGWTRLIRSRSDSWTVVARTVSLSHPFPLTTKTKINTRAHTAMEIKHPKLLLHNKITLIDQLIIYQRLALCEITQFLLSHAQKKNA